MPPHHAAYPTPWSLGSQPVMTADVQVFLDIVRSAVAREAVAPAETAFDPHRTCELLTLDRHTTLRTYSTALGLSLQPALGAPPLLGHVGAAELTFDEAWLLRLLDRSRHVDAESVAFLISSRVTYRLRAAIAFLTEGVVSRL